MVRVRAADPHDLWFGQGYAHAQDRLWQCDVQRRVSQGRLSEIAGGDGLKVDRLMRTLGIGRVARREERELDPELRALLNAYCAGFNRAAEAAGALPAEFQILRLDFEPWRPAHILAGASCSASGSRPTGSGSCCGPTWCASWAPSARPRSTPFTRPATRS